MVTQSEFGGAQRYIFEVARNLDKEQYEIVVAAGQGDGELFRKLQSVNVETFHLKQMKRAPWPWQIFLSVKEIHSLLKKEKPDVLFLCSTTAGLLGSISRLFYKVKVIYRIGGWAFQDPRAFWKNWLVLLAEKMTAPLKNVIIVNSEIDRKLTLKYRIAKKSKIFKIYNSIDANSLNFLSREEARSRLHLEQSVKTIGTVANFYKTKGLKYLIEAAHELSKAEPYLVKFVIIGEGKQRLQLENLIKKYHLEDKVFLKGRMPDAYQYLKAFDVFVLPSLKEGFPWIILETMAAEIPIITTNVGALPEIIENGKEGILVEQKNSQILAEKINWCLSHSVQAQKMGIKAKEKIEKEFVLQKMIKETERLLD